MASVTAARPRKHTVIRSFAGHLDSAPDAVYRALVARVAQLRGGDEGQSLVDEADRSVIVQGDWWYRGEYRVRAEGAGTLLEYEIVNVAPTWHWAGPIAGRAVIRDAPTRFQSLLTDLDGAGTGTGDGTETGTGARPGDGAAS